MLNSMAVRPVPTPWGESSTALSPIQSASTRRSAGYGVPSRWPRGRGQGCTALELGESTALFSLSSDGGGGEGRGEESRFYWISPLPARSSQGEGDRRSEFQCLIQWQCTPALPQGEGIARRAFANLA